MGRTKTDTSFRCQEPGCDKVFNRKDHLQRHALNHSGGDVFSCNVDGCNRKFVRADLLARHLTRHSKAAKEFGRDSGPLLPSRHPERKWGAPRSQVDPSSPSVSTPEPDTTVPGPSNAHQVMDEDSDQDSPAPSDSVPNPQPPQQTVQSHSESPQQPIQSNTAESLPPSTDEAAALELDKSLAGIMTLMAQGRTHFPPSFEQTDLPSSVPDIEPLAPVASFNTSGDHQSIMQDWDNLPALDNHVDLFSNDFSLYDATYDLNPLQNQDLMGYGWLFSQFSPSTGLIHEEEGAKKDDWAWMQAPRPAPLQPSTPKDHAASLTPTVYDNLGRVLTPLISHPEHPAYNHETVQSNFAAYFAHFDSQLPLIHKPLFDINTVAPYLVIAMLCIGAFYSEDQETCSQWQTVATKLWGLVQNSDEFVNPSAGISLLQTLILLEMHGKLMSNRPSHAKAAIMHSAYVNIARRTKIFLPKATPPEDPGSPDSIWRAAMLDETGRRCAYALFFMDSAHAAMFRHAAVLSAFELRLDLPVPDHEWNAPTGEKWHTLRFDANRRPPPAFAEALKASLQPGGLNFATSAFATSVLLHGLISICHDISRKDNVLLGMDTEDRGTSKWKLVMAKALDSYKSRLEASCSTRYGPQLLWSGLSLQCVAHIGLVSNMLDLQVFAGAPAIFGQKVGRAAYEKASENVREWVKCKDGSEAAWHAIQFMKPFVLRRVEGGPESREPGGVGDLPHLKWCLYVATLVLWSFGHASTDISFESFEQSPTDEIPSQFRQSDFYFSEALAYCDAMSFRTPTELDEADDRMKMKTSGIIAFVLNELSESRWELEGEASRLLTRLLSLPALEG
ncbi:hypothetical protein T439DRAFT_137214 [Meredithblackwellia eburnea MCA 4105]